MVTRRQALITLTLMVLLLAGCTSRPDFTVGGLYSNRLGETSISLTEAEIELGQRDLVNEMVSDYIKQVFGDSAKQLIKRMKGSYHYGDGYAATVGDPHLYEVGVPLYGTDDQPDDYVLLAGCWLNQDSIRVITSIRLIDHELWWRTDSVTGKVVETWHEDKTLIEWSCNVSLPIPPDYHIARVFDHTVTPDFTASNRYSQEKPDTTHLVLHVYRQDNSDIVQEAVSLYVKAVFTDYLVKSLGPEYQIESSPYVGWGGDDGGTDYGGYWLCFDVELGGKSTHHIWTYCDLGIHGWLTIEDAWFVDNARGNELNRWEEVGIVVPH